MRTPIFLIRLVGLLLCAVSLLLSFNASALPGEQSVLLAVLLPGLSAGAIHYISVATPLVIAATFWYNTSFREFERSSVRATGLLAVQTAMALLVAPELQFIVAVEAGLLLSPRIGGIWVFTQGALIWVTSALFPQLMAWVIPATTDHVRRLVSIALFMLLAMLYNFFAFALGWLSATGRRQAQALDLTIKSLEKTNLELKSAQQASDENARLTERLSIARELHDAIGHQLTALSVNLQVASHLSHDGARTHVLDAYQLTGELLGKVRDVVSSVREPANADFAAALRSFAVKLERPRIHLALRSLPDCFGAEISHAVLRCVQEIITNTVRHASAQNLWIETARSDEEFEVCVRDDGRGSKAVVPGNGLNGIRERIQQFHGAVQFNTQPEGGFLVTIRLPLSQATST